ncbi:MAG: gliding motility-associated C-terminal domain-containing protein [Bacteroidales bacterium]|nr:gliding motility-associated C-terminal domain-containing protein [Bacteroidales bacterium]
MRVIRLALMRVSPFIILTVIAGCCLLSAHAAGNDAGSTAQTINDSIVAPNVFTPNGDDINDVFEVTSKEGNVVSLKIFTRAGVLVFSIKAKRCRWDGYSLGGQEMANGVYYFTAEVPGSSPKVKKAGFVHLYR